MQHTTSPSKVIEAPSSVLTPELRKKMGEAAVLVAKSCDYLGAGTVGVFIRRKNNFFSSK
jgi:propionyl-CoA carboxylase alpha chain